MIAFKHSAFVAIAQALKTGIAAVVSICVARLVGLPQEYWAAISAIVVMQSQVADTMTASRDRLIGTAIGALMGAVFVAYIGHSITWFGVAVVVTMLICQSLGLDQSYRLACVTVAIVMLIPTNHTAWVTALHRFLEVAIGIVSAVAITAVPLPRRPLNNPDANV